MSANPRSLSFDTAANEVSKASIMAFAARASTEVSTLDEQRLQSLVGVLKPGTVVYVAHTPKTSLEDVVRVALKVQGLGFRASPHVVARRIESAQALRSALGRFRAAGIEEILMIAGDREKPAGEFSNTLEILDSGLTVESGISHIGVAGHPEGHPDVSPAELLAALRHKQAFADRTGSKLRIVTQFGFDPDALCTWVATLRKHGITLPVHAGIAGPTSIARLVKFAMHCGVGVSMGSMMKNMGAMANLALHVKGADEMLVGILRGGTRRADLDVAQPHIFAFGGILPTAQWLRAVADGSFDLQRGSDKFHLRA
jgi:methylenetetrahydrofolate reductase (NADPH)